MSQSPQPGGHAKLPVHIMFVCFGNTCRSPMAGAMLKARYPNTCVSSAGTGAGTGGRAHQDAIEEMKRRDRQEMAAGDMAHPRSAFIARHRTQRFAAQSADGQDVVVCIGEDNADIVVGRAARADVRTWDVEDPHNQGEQAYRACATQLDKLIGDLAAELKLS